MLTFSIVEQPARYHRFRYETEIAGGKLGGLLYGRSGSKSCVRLTLSGADASRHRSLIVIGGTVNPDGYPHPFYMHGDLCESGAFQWRRDLTSGDAGKTEFDISLEKVSLVCVPQVGDKLKEAMKRREAIQFNPYNKKTSEVKYTSKNARELRLVFQAYYVDTNGKTVASKGAIVQTDIISDIKFQTKLEIEDAHPNVGYIHAKEQEVWLLFKDTLPHFDQSQYNAFLDFEAKQIVRCEIRSLRKQLMSLNIPSISISALPPSFRRLPQKPERLRCCLRVVDLKSHVTAEHDFILSGICNLCGSCGSNDHVLDPPSKRSRISNGSGVYASAPAEHLEEEADEEDLKPDDQLVAVINLPDHNSDSGSVDSVKPEG